MRFLTGRFTKISVAMFSPFENTLPHIQGQVAKLNAIVIPEEKRPKSALNENSVAKNQKKGTRRQFRWGRPFSFPLFRGGLNRTTVKASYGAGQEFPERDGKFTMQADEPPILLSEDKAANPVEHL
ncbi:MAG TPA: hypothetical protein VK863_09240, partial [Candidatus Limnocylindrales bacterium]|nr:hypothetical protein [Candidatus Limnocylindrales bacterium]